MRILLIEDHAPLARTLSQSLSALGMQVQGCSNGLEADAALQAHAFDAVVLDLGLPGLDGSEVLRRLRQRGDMVPVLILTASGDTLDRVRGLNAGADDYLPKPFDLAELEARLRALHRRKLGSARTVLQLAGLQYDTISRRFLLEKNWLCQASQPPRGADDVFRRPGGAMTSRALDLPPREHALLEALMLQAGRPLRKAMLAERLRSDDAVLSPDALEVYVHRLRRRLAGSGAAIQTLRGLGYVLEAAP